MKSGARAPVPTLCTAVFCLAAIAAAAQEKAPSPTYGDVKSRLQERLEADAQSSPVLQKSIQFLEDQILQAVDVIESVRAENESLRQAIESLEAELAAVSAERGEAVRGYESRLNKTSEDLASEREARKARESELELRIRELADTLSLERTDKEKLQGELEGVQVELRATLVRRDEAMAELEGLRADVRKREEALAAVQGKLDATAVENERERRELSARLTEAHDALDAEKALSETSRRRLDLLNRQLAALRDQIAALNEALGASEAVNREQKVVIADLGSRLNQALATKVAELARFRSEFLGRLRQALGERSDVRIIGERFVFQSEVLFGSGEADLNPEGREELKRFAATLKDVSTAIPGDLDWVLRVDGHTDKRPIATARFPSNWELSTARATSVVKFLAEQGLPMERLAATGFAEYHPLDARDDEIAYRRNRRIEFMLTQR